MSTSQEIPLNTYVTDYPILCQEPNTIKRLLETGNNVFLPRSVLLGLDGARGGLGGAARNAQTALLFIYEILKDVKTSEEAKEGVSYDGNNDFGKLFVETMDNQKGSRLSTSGDSILHSIQTFKSRRPNDNLVLLTQNPSLRIDAAGIGIKTEDCVFGEETETDSNLLYSGYQTLSRNFWNELSKGCESWNESGNTFYRVDGAITSDWYPGLCLQIEGEAGHSYIVCKKDPDGTALMKVSTDYENPKRPVWGIVALNSDQNFALNLLMDPDIDFVSLVGQAGTGKTLLALAAGLAQTLDDKRYSEIIMTRVTIPVGEDIGFLPGTEEEKMTPWMGALTDNLEVLSRTGEGGDWGRAATNDLVKSRISIRSLNFMRGRTFLNKYLIIDEAQNLTAKQARTLLTRAGPGTKAVFIGNNTQIDTPYLTPATTGLTVAVNHYKEWEHSGHIHLRKGERSRLADYANKMTV